MPISGMTPPPPDHAHPNMSDARPSHVERRPMFWSCCYIDLLLVPFHFFIPSMRLRADIERAICEKGSPASEPPITQRFCGNPQLCGLRLSRPPIACGEPWRRSDTSFSMAMRKEPTPLRSSQHMAVYSTYLDGSQSSRAATSLIIPQRKVVRRHVFHYRRCRRTFLVLAFATTTYVQSLAIAAERDRVGRTSHMVRANGLVPKR